MSGPDAINLTIWAQAGTEHLPPPPAPRHRMRSAHPTSCAMRVLEASSATTCAKAGLRHARHRRILNLHGRRETPRNAARAKRFLSGATDATHLQVGVEAELEQTSP